MEALSTPQSSSEEKLIPHHTAESLGGVVASNPEATENPDTWSKDLSDIASEQQYLTDELERLNKSNKLTRLLRERRLRERTNEFISNYIEAYPAQVEATLGSLAIRDASYIELAHITIGEIHQKSAPVVAEQSIALLDDAAQHVQDGTDPNRAFTTANKDLNTFDFDEKYFNHPATLEAIKKEVKRHKASVSTGGVASGEVLEGTIDTDTLERVRHAVQEAAEHYQENPSDEGLVEVVREAIKLGGIYDAGVYGRVNSLLATQDIEVPTTSLPANSDIAPVADPLDAVIIHHVIDQLPSDVPDEAKEALDEIEASIEDLVPKGDRKTYSKAIDLLDERNISPEEALEEAQEMVKTAA